MSEYTPTTEQVRVAYQDHRDFQSIMKGLDRPGDVEAGREFDRWLSAHDAEVKAEALREAAKAHEAERLVVDTESMPHQDRLGYVTVSQWLRVRATRIKKEDPR